MIGNEQMPKLRAHLRKLLQEDLCLGRFRETEGSDFEFSYERMRMRLHFNQDEAAYVRMGRTILWLKKADAEDLAIADRCINEVNYRYKAVRLCRALKADGEGDYAVYAEAAFLVPEVATLTWQVIERYLDLVKSGSKLFRELHDAAAKDDRPADKAVEPPLPALRH